MFAELSIYNIHKFAINFAKHLLLGLAINTTWRGYTEYTTAGIRNPTAQKQVGMLLHPLDGIAMSQNANTEYWNIHKFAINIAKICNKTSGWNSLLCMPP